MITGTTMGEIRIASSNPWAGNRVRQMPRAASVPRIVARSVAETPTIRLFHNDGSQNDDAKKSWYQRRLEARQRVVEE